MRKLQNYESISDSFTLSVEQAKTRYNCSMYTLDKIAVEAGAVIRVGKRKLYLKNQLDDYLVKTASK